MTDLISRADVNRVLEDWFRTVFGADSFRKTGLCRELRELPSAQPSFPQAHENDCISREEAIDEIRKCRFVVDVIEKINGLPSAQPERTCVNCGRTANNGGWYADGRTRCPIEEHYALPKDGFCHLWEKRNVTDDDYPERREE